MNMQLTLNVESLRQDLNNVKEQAKETLSTNIQTFKSSLITSFKVVSIRKMRQKYFECSWIARKIAGIYAVLIYCRENPHNTKSLIQRYRDGNRILEILMYDDSISRENLNAIFDK